MRPILSITALALSGCATTVAPGTTDGRLGAAAIEYVLPVTKMTVSEELVITGCQPSAQLRPSVSVIVSGIAGPERHVLRGADWTSWTKSRDVAVTLNDNRTIKTVNATASDRTFAVITNVVKGLTTLAGAFSSNPSSLSCTKATEDALGKVKALEARIEALRKLLPTSSPGQTAEIVEAVNGLATEAARLKTSKPLTLSLTGQDIDLLHGGGEINWKESDVNQWLTVDDGRPGARLVLGYCLTPVQSPDPEAKCTIEDIDAGVAAVVTPPRAPTACPGDSACARTVIFRQPKPALLTIVARGDGYGPRKNEKLKAVTAPVAQWGEYAFLGLDVGLAQSRTVGLTLDEFGRPISFSWKSDARAESITGGASGVIDAAAAFDKARDGRELADRNAAIADLESQQKYNKLRLCEEIIRSGGFKCPDA